MTETAEYQRGYSAGYSWAESSEASDAQIEAIRRVPRSNNRDVEAWDLFPAVSDADNPVSIEAQNQDGTFEKTAADKVQEHDRKLLAFLQSYVAPDLKPESPENVEGPRLNGFIDGAQACAEDGEADLFGGTHH